MIIIRLPIIFTEKNFMFFYMNVCIKPTDQNKNKVLDLIICNKKVYLNKLIFCTLYSRNDVKKIQIFVSYFQTDSINASNDAFHMHSKKTT